MPDRNRQRILVVTRNLPPLVGGMERLNWHMASELGMRADVRIVGPSGAAALAPPGIAVLEVPVRPLAWFLLVAALRSVYETIRFKPEVVLAGSGLMAPIVWIAARCCGAATVTYIHGLDVVADSSIYRSLWLPTIRRMDRVIANSYPTAKLCRAAGIQERLLAVVHPGVEILSIPMLDSRTEEGFREKHGVGSGPLMLSVGRLTSRKGLREFVRDVLPGIVEVHPEATLVVVGGPPSQAIRAEAQTPASILRQAQVVGVAQNVRILGLISEEQLLEAWAAADVHVFPVRELQGDPEGFGMVAIEAAAHGVPTIAYAVGGVPDAVAPGASGYLVPPGDWRAFQAALLRVIEAPLSKPSVVEFARRFTWRAFGEAVSREVGSVTRASRP